MENKHEEMLLRLEEAGITLTEEQKKEYVAKEDDLGEVAKGATLPVGFKRCGACGHAKKFYLFNRNRGSKTNTTGNCKECQRKSAAKSYQKTKQRRNYKKYYQENKEMKQAQARKYYQKNKERLKEKHKQYLKTRRGRLVMQRAHAKRRKALAENAGIPYTRELVIERDSVFLGKQYPVCYLCGEPIEDTSGQGLHIDHVIPIVTGGLDCFTNVACTHAACNLRKEKDARELSAEQIQEIGKRAREYIDAHPDKF